MPSCRCGCEAWDFVAALSQKRKSVIVAGSNWAQCITDPRGVTAQAIVNRMMRDLEAFWAARREVHAVDPPHYLEEAIAVAKRSASPTCRR